MFLYPLRHDIDLIRKRSSTITVVVASLAVAETDFIKLMVKYTQKISHTLIIF